MTVNGKQITLQTLKQPSLSALLEHLDLSSTPVAIEKNGEILAKESYSAVKLQEQDTLEIIKFVGGG